MQENHQLSIVSLTCTQLENLLLKSAKMGAMAALAAVGASPNDLKTRAEMSRLHGKARISHLISAGKLTPRRVEGEERIRYSEMEYQSLIL